MNNVDKYLNAKKLFAKIMGYLVLLVSFKFSAAGFGFKTDDSLFVGYILAFAVTAGELIFNTQVKKLNWTIVVIGILSYAYSIWTNILGFYVYRGETEIVFALNFHSLIPIFGGAFMDIFPEMALAWAYGAGHEGDFIGNLTKLGQVDNEISPTPRYTTKNTYLSQLPKRDNYVDPTHDNLPDIPQFMRDAQEKRTKYVQSNPRK